MTSQRGEPAVDPETLSAWVGKAAEDFALNDVTLDVADVHYLEADCRDARRLRCRRALRRAARRATSLPIFIIPTLGSDSGAGLGPSPQVDRDRTTRGLWVTANPLAGPHIVLSRQAAIDTLSHELGHAVGLEHRSDPSNVMCSCDRRQGATFSAEQGRKIAHALGPPEQNHRP